MKAKIEKYLGPNKVLVDGKAVRLAVNSPHPAVGQEVEYKESQIVGENPEPTPEVKPPIAPLETETATANVPDGDFMLPPPHKNAPRHRR